MSIALEKGIALGKANRRKEAIEYLKQALIENPRETEAWMWISQLVDDRPTRKYCYERVLEIEPDNFLAKQFLDFQKDTDANLKFFPDPTSPLQSFFENQRQVSSRTNIEKPFPAPSTSSDYHPTAPSQFPRRLQPQANLKKKKRTSWVIYLLIMLLATCLLSTGMYFTYAYLPNDLDFGGGFKTNIFTLGLEILQLLVAMVWGFYWIISGYSGVVSLIKKGYVLEYIGCNILLAGIPLVLPALLGPFMQMFVDTLQKKNG